MKQQNSQKNTCCFSLFFSFISWKRARGGGMVNPNSQLSCRKKKQKGETLFFLFAFFVCFYREIILNVVGE